MAPPHSQQLISSASSTTSHSEQSWTRRERNDTVLSTYLHLGHPARTKAITSTSQLFLPNTNLDEPSSSVPRLGGSNETAGTSTEATSTRAPSPGKPAGLRAERSFSENDLPDLSQEPAESVHSASTNVYIPSGTPTWIEHELSRFSPHAAHITSSASQRGQYDASINTGTGLGVDPNILSETTSVMSISSSDHEFEIYARQGTWDSGSGYGKRIIMWNWVRKCGEGFTMVRVGMKRKCKKWVKSMKTVGKRK